MTTSPTSRWLFLVAAFLAIVAQVLVAASIAEAQGVKRERFNHLATGFALTGAHEQAKCETCHQRGIFKGTPKDCVQCQVVVDGRRVLSPAKVKKYGLTFRAVGLGRKER